MADREKVKTGLELCQQGFDCPEDCPYLDDCNDLMKPMFIELAKDALAMMKEHDELLHKKQHDVDRLCTEISEWKHKFHDKSLKEQEAVKPVKQIEENEWTVCGHCRKHLISKWMFCPYCGRKVKWNESDDNA